jgi:hypothetical protein
MVGPAACREACVHLQAVYGMSERRACRYFRQWIRGKFDDAQI